MKNILKILNKTVDSDEFLEIVNKLKILPHYMYFGHNQDNQPTFEDLSKNPHALFVGQMGTGKSICARTSVLSYLIANTDTLCLIADPYKGAADFRSLQAYKNVIPFLGDERYLQSAIDLCYYELDQRRNSQYLSKDMSKILLVIEEGHSVSNFLNFENDYQSTNTSTYKFNQLLMRGKSYGINVHNNSSRSQWQLFTYENAAKYRQSKYI